MEYLENMSLNRKRDILHDWITQMDEDGLNGLLVEYLDCEYLEDNDESEE